MNESELRRFQYILDRVNAATIIPPAVFLWSVAVFGEWATGVRFMAILFGGVDMKAFTASCFALWALSTRYPGAIYPVIMVAVYTIGFYLFGIDAVGIEDPFGLDVSDYTSSPGRMSVFTAVAFLAVGVYQINRSAHMLGLLWAAVVFGSIVHYLNVSSHNALGVTFTDMAVPTAILFGLIAYYYEVLERGES